MISDQSHLAGIVGDYEFQIMNQRIQPIETRQPAPARTGVTLMECIFAIGVILTGLVGLAALIPVAARNAQTTMEVDRSISESTSASAKAQAQALTDLSELVIIDKPAAESEAYAFSTYGYSPSNSFQTIQLKITTTTAGQKLESPGYGHSPFASGLMSSICIDPLGFPNPAYMTPGLFSAVDEADTAFDYSRFPYFGERYNPLAPPNASVGNQAGPSAFRPNWPMSPRMYRATLKSPMIPGANPVQARNLMSALAARSIFQSSGGIGRFDAADHDLPSSVLFNKTNIGGTLVDASRDRSAEYTWFATLAPPFLGGDLFRQSIVVVRQRVAPVPQRSGDPLALQKTAYTIDDEDDNPIAERLVWANPLEVIGFNGGSGGEVTVYGSQAVSDQLVQGEWVMLSRQPHELSGGAPNVPTGPAVHRWYRVLRVDEPQIRNGYAWAGGTHDVWSRRIALAGSDWAFDDDSGVDFSNDSAIDDTFITIVDGAISVIDSDVTVRVQ